MAKSSAQQQLYAELLERYGRQVADAFYRAIDDLRSSVELQRVTAAIEAGDVEAALEALHIDPEAFAELPEEIRRAYIEGGRAAASTLPKRNPDGTALVVRFDGTNPEAERWLSDHSSRLVTRITEDQREAVRDKLYAGLSAGKNPRSVALEIVGRVSRVSGKREGGILGLTSQQAGFVEKARTQLASDNPADLEAYLGRGLRDKRFDRSVAKAIREGTPLPADTQAKMVRAYETKMLRYRGETIGRVEAMTSLQTAKREAFRQGVASGKFAESEIERTWRSARDRDVRHTHAILDGQKKRGMTEPFVSVSGAMLIHPMDTSLGAGMDEIGGCRCDCAWRIRWLDRAA